MHARFCPFGADLFAQSVLVDKISVSELSRKFTKSALLVGLPKKRVVQCGRSRMSMGSSRRGLLIRERGGGGGGMGRFRSWGEGRKDKVEMDRVDSFAP